MPYFSNPLDALRYHVSGAIERGEAQPVTAIEAEKHWYMYATGAVLAATQQDADNYARQLGLDNQEGMWW